MLRIRFSLTLVAMLGCSVIANADYIPFFPGPVSPGTAAAGYDPFSGEMVVSINGVNNWYIRSASLSLTGDAPSHIPIVPGSLPSDNDEVIGETGFGVATGTDVRLGRVAQSFLPFGDLTINWNAGLGMPLQTRFIDTGAPPPSATINGPFVIDLASDPLNITLDASSSGAGVLSYMWDIDGQPGHEIDTGTTATFEITDVAATFGGVGVYTVRVSVSDIGGSDSASTTVTIINTIPEPSTLALTGLVAALASTFLRRRNA